MMIRRATKKEIKSPANIQYNTIQVSKVLRVSGSKPRRERAGEVAIKLAGSIHRQMVTGRVHDEVEGGISPSIPWDPAE